MLTQEIKYEQTYNTDMSITIKKYSIIYSDGDIVTIGNPSTTTISPLSDIRNIEIDIDTQKMIDLFWTEEVIAAYKSKLEELRQLDEINPNGSLKE